MEMSSFFNSVNGDRQYDMEEFARYFRQFLSSGIYHTDNNPGLRVRKETGLQTSMDVGSAFLEGFMYANDSKITFDHDSADATNDRIDRIVLRLDRSVDVRSIQSMIKKGTPSTNAVAPPLQRDDLVYEISLAKVLVNQGSTTVNSVEDERFDESVAGLVSSLITIPVERFEEEWSNWFNELRSRTPIEDFEEELYTWYDQLQANNPIQQLEEDWNNWFTGIQAQNPAMGGMRISIGDEPTNPTVNDIWIDSDD